MKHCEIKKLKIFLSIAMTILILSQIITVSSDPITITQPLDITLVGGDSKTINLTVTYGGSGTATCKMSSIVYPDGIGINISYIPSEFTITTHQIVQMTVNTSLALVPGEYIIETTVSAETSSPKPGPITIHTRPDKPPVEPPVEPPIEPPVEHPVTNETTNKTTNETIILPSEPCNLWFLSPFIIALIIIPFLIYYLMRKKHKKELLKVPKKHKEEKEK